MDLQTIVEIIVAIGVIITGVFGLIRYLVSQNTKREAAILQHHESQQRQMMEFYDKKNGHIERIANRFTESNNAMGRTLGKLTTEIKILADRHR